MLLQVRLKGTIASVSPVDVNSQSEKSDSEERRRPRPRAPRRAHKKPIRRARWASGAMPTMAATTVGVMPVTIVPTIPMPLVIASSWAADVS